MTSAIKIIYQQQQMFSLWNKKMGASKDVLVPIICLRKTVIKWPLIRHRADYPVQGWFRHGGVLSWLHPIASRSTCANSKLRYGKNCVETLFVHCFYEKKLFCGKPMKFSNSFWHCTRAFDPDIFRLKQDNFLNCPNRSILKYTLADL